MARGVHVRFYPAAMRRLAADEASALEQAAEAVVTDLVMSQTLPFASPTVEAKDGTQVPRRDGVVPGELQGSVHSERSRSAEGRVSVVASTPYARNLYYHPDWDYYRGTNPRAGGAWFEPYKRGGAKAGFVRKAYEVRLRAMRGRGA